MLAEQQLALVARNLVSELIAHPELVADPQRHRHHVRLQSARRARDVRGQQAFELDERLLVERDVIELAREDARFAQAVLDGA